MSQNNQNRFAAMASDGNAPQRKNSGKKGRKGSEDDQTAALLADRKSLPLKGLNSILLDHLSTMPSSLV